MRREELIGRVRDGGRCDVVVIGGGATGLGTAVDAAQRGYRTLLLEARDFAQGTSGRSTKLVHGGVRYLARGEVALVREALHEQALLLRNAPHLVHLLGFVVPAYAWWDVPFYGLGLAAYDVLAGRRGPARSRIIGPTEALRRIPTLEPHGLRGAVIYADGQFDDARLAVALLRTFLDLGGTALNAAPVVSLLKEGGKLTGLVARDAESGEQWTIEARAVVNATGVFADAIRALDDPATAPMLSPSRGAHVVLDRAFLPGADALMVPKTDDGRVLFAIPWHGRVLVGTTDTPVPAPSPEPTPTAAEVEFLLAHAARYLTRDPTPADVLSTFAGLRPLVRHQGVRSTAKLSRDSALTVSPSGLVTITGGKWTTYRRMAADSVDRAAEVAGLGPRPCHTAGLPLHGAPEEGVSPPDGPFAHHGTDAPALERLVAEHPEWGAPLHPRLPYHAVEVVWAARHELARTVEDVLSRRTRSLLLDARAAAEAAPLVAALLAGELGRDEAWQEAEVGRFRALAGRYKYGIEPQMTQMDTD